MMKNPTPMLGAGVSPAQLMLGRNNLLEPLEEARWVESSTEHDATHTMQYRVQSELQSRPAVILEDARRVSILGVNRKAREGSLQDFKLCEIAQLYLKGEETKMTQSTPGFRIIGLTSHHLVVE